MVCSSLTKGGITIEEQKKYGIIYADPPWRYKQKRLSGSAEKHYPTMSLTDICSLAVPELAARDCILFLWATFPMLPEALRVIRAWQFQYKTVGFVWVKTNKKSPGWFMGTGFWTRSNAEICLIATRGHPKRQAKNIRQLIVSPVQAHSQKPEEVRERILQLLGNIPRIELFARERVDGWDCWGNEINSDIQLNADRGQEVMANV